VIAEAIDTAMSLGWAFLIWLVIVAFFVGAALYALAVTVAFACRAGWRGVAVALALVQRSRTPEPLPETQKPPQARVAHSRPTWAQPDEEAA
jgi:hypothetical protein